ncbi:MAG: HAD family hydrolase [Qipengyuania citrea]|uniref:HAD family hydrolase n=1 Tax=Qipengyuania citrea TaxID=225971 RepID=UPI0032665251
MKSKALAIFDFDNTLFDWVHVWYSCFKAMMDEVEAKTGLSIQDLADEIRPVHQIHGTSEYAFLLEAIPSLQVHLDRQPAGEVFAEAIQAFRKTRRKELRLYPGVADALLRIKGRGARIAIYTESQSFYSFYRLKRLGLDGVVDRIYTPPDHELPDGFMEEGRRHYAREFYHLRHTEQRHTPRGELKPNPDLLQQIITDFGVAKDEAVYVGDSRQKDVAMAEDANVDYAWASYGEAQETEAYEMLKLVTHWTDDDVRREAEIRARKVDAKIELKKSIIELFDHYRFSDYNA